MIHDLIKLNAIIINSPPYSPDFNPIEEKFAIIHNKFKFKSFVVMINIYNKIMQITTMLIEKIIYL